ncbi:MAG: energy transducer TonB [Pseudomonadota bacterium]
MVARSRFQSSRAVRLAAVVAAVLIDAALMWALISGLATKWSGRPPVSTPPVTVVDIPLPAPQPQPQPQPASTSPAARAAPAVPRTPAAIVRPPAISLAPPRPAVTAGSPALAAAGSGSGGTGSGSGAGGDGAGDGAGLAKPAERIAGALSDRDYPREAGGRGGTVAISFQVAADGSVDRCAVIASSGTALLDELTCRLVIGRFRYRPARGAGGQPVASTLRTTFTWGTR